MGYNVDKNLYKKDLDEYGELYLIYLKIINFPYIHLIK